MNPDFQDLASWIDKTYDVKTVNIIYDFIDHNENPRINVCFEFDKERIAFNGDSNFGFDESKQQEIANQFKLMAKNNVPEKKKGILGFLNGEKAKYEWKNLWVVFSAFEPIAKMEANEKLPESSVNKLKEDIDDENLWEVSKAFSGVTFFLYTDEQVKKYENGSEKEIWANKYFDLLKQFDEFNYFKRDSFSIYLDSKENFDTNYESNWFYYYK